MPKSQERFGLLRFSPAPKSLHDFDLIAVSQALFGMAAARDDDAIELDRNPTFPIAGALQQFADRWGVVESHRLAVEDDLHCGSLLVRLPATPYMAFAAVADARHNRLRRSCNSMRR